MIMGGRVTYPTFGKGKSLTQKVPLKEDMLVSGSVARCRKKKADCLGYIGDDKLPIYKGITSRAGQAGGGSFQEKKL